MLLVIQLLNIQLAMNCFAFAPISFSNYRNVPLIPANQFVQPQFNILPFLSEALKQSFASYSDRLAPKLLSSLQNLKKSEAAQQKSIPCIEIQSGTEEQEGKNQNLKSIENQIQEEKLIIQKNSDAKNNSNSSQNVTNEQIPLEHSSQQLQKKSGSQKGKSKSAKFPQSKDSFSVKIPKLDMIDTAYLPKRGLTAEQVQKRKQKLLLRQVDNWDDKVSSRRDKRQIRMLNN